MLLIGASPILALALSYLQRTLQINKTTFLLLFSTLVVPSIIIWTTGYRFSNPKITDYAIMLIITYLLVILFSVIEVKFVARFMIALFVSALLLAFAFIVGMAASYGGGGREIINQTRYKNYVALHLAPQLYEEENTIRILKVRMDGLVEKTIFETIYLDSLSELDCRIFVRDNKTSLVYDLCRKKFIQQ